MAGISKVTVHPDSDSDSDSDPYYALDFYQLFYLLNPDPYYALDFDQFFSLLNPEDRRNCLAVLRGEPELARRSILRLIRSRPNPKEILFALKSLSEAKLDASMETISEFSKSNKKAGKEIPKMKDDEDRRTIFEAPASSSSLPLDHGVDNHPIVNLDIHKPFPYAVDRRTIFEAPASSSSLPLDHGVDNHPIVNLDIHKPFPYAVGTSCPLNFNVGLAMKDILFVKGNQEPVTDYLTWYKTLNGINAGVILSLIFKSISNNPESLLNEIIILFAAACAVVGFFSSLAGLYLSTYKPKTLPFDCDPEVSIRKWGNVGGLATGFGFTAGVLLLLPNNLFRVIAVAVACVAMTIPIYTKIRPFAGEAADVALPSAVTDIPSSGEEDDLADMV